MTDAERTRMKWYQEQLNEVEPEIAETLKACLDDLGNPWPRLGAVEGALLAAMIRIERLEKAAL